MNILPVLAVLGVLATGQLSTKGSERGFIRQPGRYALDESGSHIAIQGVEPDSWSMTITFCWMEKTASGAIDHMSASDMCSQALKAKGWFVFVEDPQRVWVFDGLAFGYLVTRSDREMGSTVFSLKDRAQCPDKIWEAIPKRFWSALPEPIRKTRKEVEPVASHEPPPRASVSDAPDTGALDSLPAPGSRGAR